MKRPAAHEKSIELGILIFSCYGNLKAQFPETASQLLRSATSIGANIAESQTWDCLKRSSRDPLLVGSS